LPGGIDGAKAVREGLTHNIKEQGFTNPHREESRRLWYATAIGTERFIADVILAQVRQFQNDHLETRNLGDPSADVPTISEEFSAFMENAPAPWTIGEIVIRPTEDESFHLFHYADREIDPATLRILSSPEDLREVIRVNEEGLFRPLRAAPDLQRGWLLHAPDAPGVQLALDYIYPGELANWTLWRHDALRATPWDETAERQTGRFRIVRQIDALAMQELVGNYCQSGCLKRRLWVPASQPVEMKLNEIPLLCPEACNFLVGKAREKLKGPGEE
jgi:sirohydrochlorin cobaltochelatase